MGPGKANGSPFKVGVAYEVMTFSMFVLCRTCFVAFT